MLPADIREEQATACLEAAEKHRAPLLALATKLAGCPEEGMELFQQTILNCHDATQRNGFAGDRYEFYLYTSLRNYYHRQQKKHLRELRVDFHDLEAGGSSSRDDEGPAPWAAKAGQKQSQLTAAAHVAATDELAHLAEQVQQELRARFPPAHRVALRLHAAGYSCREIAEMTGSNEDQSCVWRRIERMKAAVRATFQQAWQALSEPEY